MDWIRKLAAAHTLETIPQLYKQTIDTYGTVHGYTFASAFDALNIAHANGVNIATGLESGTLRLITADNRYALINLKKDDKKMTNINVTLTESQLEELVQHVDILDYVDYMHMIDWNDRMSSLPATEIIDSVDMHNFDTCDEYAVMDGLGTWVSADSLEEILMPYLDEMLQEYLEGALS